MDCDNLWVYEGEYGESRSDLQGLIYTQALPRFLELLDSYSVKATFFIIGKDLDNPSCRKFCRKALNAGHRLANHTTTHPPDFGSMSYSEKRFEIAECDKRFTEILDIKPDGFRAPGYYLNSEIVDILLDLGYSYEGSALPGYGNLLMSLYYNVLLKSEKGKLFGRLDYFIFPRTSWRFGPRESDNAFLNIIPIATMPVLRLPIHTTFIYLFGLLFLKTALAALRKSAGHHVYLFHAIDFLECPSSGKLRDKVVTFRLPLDRRLKLAKTVMEETAASHVLTTEDYLRNMSGHLPTSVLGTFLLGKPTIIT